MASRLVLSLKKRKNCYGSSIRLLSPAKVNLYLNITGTYRENGPYRRGLFHRIESVMERISLCDTLTITVRKEPQVGISSNDPTLEGSANLCYKAAHLLREECGVGFGFDVNLTKKIPIGSGLGGGSSNAATTLLGINRLLGLKLSEETLYRLGDRLGSDVNFFLAQSQFALCEGRGQIVTPLRGKSLEHFILWPGVGLLTKKIYQRTRAKLTKYFSNAKMISYALSRGDRNLLVSGMFNALEKSALQLCSPLQSLKRTLLTHGVFSQVTGSGSALYTLGDRNQSRIIRAVVPKEWSVFKVATF